jgi:hypothetical protein
VTLSVLERRNKMSIKELIDTAKNCDIQIDEEQAALILNCLDENGYSELIKTGDKLELQWIDQSGEMKKDVSLDQILVFVANEKYNENLNIMDELDEIKTISIDNLGLYCTNLLKLIDNEKELHLIQGALTQTKNFKQLSQSIESLTENKPKKVIR